MPRTYCLIVLALFMLPVQSQAQTFPTDDPIIQQMWEVGVTGSQVETLGHELLDVIGPRLTGTQGLIDAQAWIQSKYDEWGISARREEYGTWRGWEQGLLHVDMLEPRRVSLEAELLAWSAGTDGPVSGQVMLPPADISAETYDDFVRESRGKFLLASAPEPMCRAAQELEANARPETVDALNERRSELRREWARRMAALRQAADGNAGELAGILTSRWSGGWGVNKVFSASSGNVEIDVSCEDYGLLVRLAESGHTPTIRVNAEARDLGTVPQFNVVGQITGTELPNEYVLLHAHLDSWHSATGATDNGTGTLTMLEAMRILKETYPNPRRTIIVGHWGAEEQGLIGSGSFREDHPDVVTGLQAAFNQDNGTWRFEKIDGQAYADAANHLPRWMNPVPTEIASRVLLELPGPQANQGSDHTSFVCAGAPSFRLQSPYDEYRQYTWHTNRDTYDKIVFDDLKENATLAAMLAYMASEDPVRFDRTQANLPGTDFRGNPRTWGECRAPRRSMGD